VKTVFRKSTLILCYLTFHHATVNHFNLFIITLLKVPGTRRFILLPNERNRVRIAIDLLSSEIQNLEAQKKLEKKKVDDAREIVSKALQHEEKVRKKPGREQGTVIHKVEHVLKTHHIAKPYYHGGKYHGKAMVHLMDKSQIIMEDIKNILVNVHDGFQGNSLNQTELCSQQEFIE
jgi:hypothetical protein